MLKQALTLYTNKELKKSNRLDNSSHLEYFARFSLYIINIAGRNSEAAMGAAGAAQRPVLRVNEPKKTGARSARALREART